jgi:hypothetical protein
MLIPMVLKMTPEVSRALDQHYLARWTEALQGRDRPPEMFDDSAFEADVTRRVQYDQSLYAGLLNGDLLNSVQKEVRISGRPAMEIARLFERRGTKLKPLFEILELDRRQILRRAKTALPLWRRVGILRALARLVGFRRPPLSAGPQGQRQESSGREDGGPRNGVEQAADAKKVLGPAPQPVGAGPSRRGPRPMTRPQLVSMHRQRITSLKEHFCGKEKSVAAALDELIELWNPIYDERARADLIEDVNGMIRSFMRGLLRRGVSPPNAQRIASLAQRLTENPAFDRIRKRDQFRRYIELYMVKVLADHHGVTV